MTLLLLRAGRLAVDLAPSAGGSIACFRVDNVDVLRPMTAADIESGRGNNAAAYPLVPFSNRIANGRLDFEGQVFQLARNWPGVNHPMHGDGWSRSWRVMRADDKSVEIAFEHERAAASGGWPFRYRARQSYRLLADRLIVDMAIDNLEDRPVPAGIGLHPFFTREDDTDLCFAAPAVWHTDAEVLPVKRTPVPPEWDFSRLRCVNEVVLDNCFDGWGGRASIVWPRRRLRLDLEASELLRHLVVYVPPGQPYFCVEPVSHASGEVGALPLAPGATRRGEIVFRLSDL
ncbi:aldose 1-epimerase [Enhydrobacter aerosaccus]|uniref:Aldose 1-epimerase n=1 Tax=Enhydrobacter aerosaccus TaxID=225324 RepID=A0A1T4TI21_9HYPH|nr:aldose 1-epimerase [Enhydrobacter aerosaccus]SKA40100.1 aldose 1-epimerase [Enhydrobacter aerosaccus]